MAWRSPPSSNPVSPILRSSSPTGPQRIAPLSLTPEPIHSTHNINANAQPLTLVIPTVRAPKVIRRAEALSPKTGRPYPNRLRGHRPTPSASIEVVPPASVEDNWVAPLGKFDIEQETAQLEGYQLWAVEKWVVDRSRFMKVVVVWTGEAKDVITVTVITPSATLTNEQAQAQFEEASRMLRRDGAKPRQTVFGIIMVTSLANFRSDLNIVRIPHGNYLDARDTLYVNINLLRLGSSGRTALTMESPGEAVQERLRQLYSIPAIAVQRQGFETVVLEFIKLIQSALSIFDMFDISEDPDGLLCDATVDSIQRWTLEVGERLQDLRLEPVERILDPTIVAAILSVVASTRSRLVSILPAGANVPRDPYVYPRSFTEALALASPPHMTRQVTEGAPARAFLSASLVEHINRQYKRKTVEVKSYRLPNLNPTSLVSLIPSDPFSGPAGGGNKSNAEVIVPATSDLIAFSKSSCVISKDPIESLQLVWTGKIGPGLSHARQAMAIEERRLAEERDAENKSDARSGEDDEGLLNKGLFAIRRGGQEISARLNSLPSLPGGNRKKQSVDLSSSQSLFPPSISSSRVSPDIGGPKRLYSDGNSSPFIPEERALSADEGTRKHQRPLLSSFNMHSALTTSNFSMSFTTTPLNLTPPRPKTKSLDLPLGRPPNSRRPSAQRTIPPTTAPLEVNSDDEGVPRRIRRNRLHPRNLSRNGRDSVYLHNHVERRLSMSDLSDWQDVPCLNTDQMKVDVHYVSSIAELSRRKRRLQLALDSVKELMGSLVLVEEILRHGQERQQGAREDFNRKVDSILPGVEELSAIRALPLETRKLSFSAIPRDAPFKSNAVTAAETLKSSKYKAYSDIERIATLKADVQRHRDQFWQQRRLAYLPPETKKDEEDLTLSLGSKCPFLWSLQFMYKLMLLTVLWAGMFRRGEIQSSVDDGWRRSTVFGTRLDRKGRTQADIDNIDREITEDRELEWTFYFF